MKKEILIPTQSIDASKIARNINFEPRYEYRVIGKPKYLLRVDDLLMEYPFRTKSTKNIEQKYEYDYEINNRGNSRRIAVFNSFSDLFNYLEKNKDYNKKEQENDILPEIDISGFNFDVDTNDQYLTLPIYNLNYFELPLVERTEILSGEKIYLSIADCRKIDKLDKKKNPNYKIANTKEDKDSKISELDNLITEILGYEED